MKIAVSSSGKDLDSQLDPRFGRCAYFLIVNIEDMSFDSFVNENSALGGGAGIQAAQFVASLGAKAVITGNCGPNAVDTHAAAGVGLFTGQSGTVREAIEKYRKGSIHPTTNPNVASHYEADETVSMSPSQQGAPGGRMCMGRSLGGGSGIGGGRGNCRDVGIPD